VADVAVVLLDQHPRLLEARSMAGIGGRFRRRQRGDGPSHRLQIVVAQFFCHCIHRLG
jgi:hypothetical protein